MTTNTPEFRTIRIQVSEKGKLRLVDADLFPGQGNAAHEPYQRKHVMSNDRTYDDGIAMIKELTRLAFSRRDAGQSIDPEELLPFLDDIEKVLVRGWTEMSEAASKLKVAAHNMNTASEFMRRWCVRIGNARPI
ncbi:MAG: hypothetical protein HQM01_10565 [Magnetococcales bacterium]|nr:hypothetical protein [Magnetococcales bacterium]